jgi:hypothetical protein
MNKFFNKKIIVNGQKYDSKSEYNRYLELKQMLKDRKISNLLSQVKFQLIPKQKGERAVIYIADYVYTENGKTIIEDVKSEYTRKDKVYIIKRKLMKLNYPDVEFREVVL